MGQYVEGGEIELMQTVVIAGGTPTEDVLGFTNQNGITGNFSGTTLTLSGAASTPTGARKAAVLRSS